MRKALLFGLVMLLCISFASAVDDYMYEEPAAWIYDWETNPCVSQVIKNGTAVNLAVKPIICGVEYLETPGVPWTDTHYFLRCYNVTIKVISYFGTVHEVDYGWKNLTSYYDFRYGTWSAVDNIYENYMGGLYQIDGMYWGILFNATVDAPVWYQDFAMSGRAIYRLNMTMYGVGSNTIKIYIKPNQAIENNHMNMQWEDPAFIPIYGGVVDLEASCASPHCTYSETINLTVAKEGVVYGDCKSTKTTATPPHTDAFTISFGDYAQLFYIILMVGIGVAILFIGGVGNMKIKMAVIALMELLLLFIGVSIGVLSWVYLLILLVIAVGIFVIKFKDWFS